MVVSRTFGPKPAKLSSKRSKKTGFQGEFDPFSDFFAENFGGEAPKPSRHPRGILVDRGGQRPPPIPVWKAPKFVRITLFTVAPLIGWTIFGILAGTSLWIALEIALKSIKG